MSKLPTPPKPGSSEAAMLGELLDLVNGVTHDEPLTDKIAKQLSGAIETVPQPPPASVIKTMPLRPPEPPATPVDDAQVFIEDKWHAAPPVTSTTPVKLFFTGRLGSGKDYLASAAGCTVLGFADPLYAVASYYFGLEVTATKNKDLPGMRAFLQIVGQWGRGTTSEQYPLTAPRAIFVQRVRSDGEAGCFGYAPVDWASYGINEDIWLDSLIARASALPDVRIAVTNCRFQNEFERLQKEGFEHWHVMAGVKTWTARLAAKKLTPDSPAIKDVSEQLAAKLDANVIRQCSAQKTGPALKCVWSDESTPRPSPRLSTVADFLRTLKGGAQ